MNWINELLWGNSVAHTVLLLAFVIAVGTAVGKLKIKGISLGMTMVLFVGIAASHFGLRLDHDILHFVKEFGLILFVYAVGLQVGPGFFASFKKGGIKLNLLATGIVFLGIVTTVTIHFITGIPISTMVGILSGAVTNTPGLGAAQEAYTSMNGGNLDPSIALGYAVAYPLGVFGIIFSMVMLRRIFKIDIKAEREQLCRESGENDNAASALSVEVLNTSLFGNTIQSLTNSMCDHKFVISRIMHRDGKIEMVSSSTIMNEGDKVLIITTPHESEEVAKHIGRVVEIDLDEWHKSSSNLVSRRIIVTHSDINGKSLAQINLRHKFGVNVTRINRSGIDLVADPHLELQMGDKVMVVGPEAAVKEAGKLLGNKLKRLNEPNIVPLFIGIALGVFLGSIPFVFPGIPQPVKLGLAGGPLIVAILMSVFGSKLKLITYTTLSANLMLREVGICLFLACVGISAGEQFVETIINNDGLKWIGLGVIITVTPLIIIGIVGRLILKLNFMTLIGLLAGSTTDPPALSYATSSTGSDAPSISYATVYPLTMFLRVLSAQILILLFA